MKIWVDADACPVVIKEVLYKVAERTKICIVLVANMHLRVPESEYISSIQVEQGFDVADNEIVERVEAGDLVITADIPLAADVIAKDCLAINPRGDLYTKDNIKSRLYLRDFMETLRGSGVETGGPPPMNTRDKEMFANSLDRLLAKYLKN